MNVEAKLERGFERLQKSVENKRIPGGVLGVVDRHGERAIRSIGSAQLVPVARPMRDDTWFDLASLTKVIFTTESILALAKAGTIDLDAPLASVLPDFRQYREDNWERKVTFRQCLGHQTPFPGVFPIYTYGRDPDLLRHWVLQHEWTPGPPVYSDINYILLGLALERLEGKAIRQMDPGPGFAWSADSAQAAATENDPWRGRVLCGEVHDENCAALQGSGHAGLFGTGTSVLDFAHRLLTTAGPDAPIRTRLSATRTHGWEIANPGWQGGDKCSPETIGHTGFTGVGLWIDFGRGHAWTLLTNRVHPTRHGASAIFKVRPAVGDLISED